MALLPSRVLVDVRLAAEVLPVVGVLTFITHVTPHLVVERAPDSLEVEHVEVIVLVHFMKKINRKLFFKVSEGTQIAKVARIDVVGPLVAELCLVLLWVVEGLNSVVRLGAAIAFGTLACFSVAAHFRRIGAKGPPPVLIMIEEAFLLVVAVFFDTGLSFEYSQVQERHAISVASRAVR